MMKISLKIIAVSLLCTVIIGFLPRLTHAQVPNGGLDVGDTYGICDCSGDPVFSWFAPEFVGPVPTTGALVWYPGSFLFASYTLHPAAWQLGFFTPGVQACWQYVGFACVPVYTMGLIDSYTGTSPL